jgi:hypothetical protein
MAPPSFRFSIARDAVEAVLRRLTTLPPSADVVGLRTKAEEYLGEVEGWSQSPPTPSVSEELMRSVLKLQIKVGKLERDGPEGAVAMTAYGVRVDSTGQPIQPGARLTLDWPVPAHGVWKFIGLRVTEEASAFDLLEVWAHQTRLSEISMPCAVFAPYIQAWELDSLSPTVPREVDPERFALPAAAVRFAEHALVVGSHLRLKVANRHSAKALRFRAALFVSELR